MQPEQADPLHIVNAPPTSITSADRYPRLREGREWIRCGGLEEEDKEEEEEEEGEERGGKFPVARLRKIERVIDRLTWNSFWHD